MRLLSFIHRPVEPKVLTDGEGWTILNVYIKGQAIYLFKLWKPRVEPNTTWLWYHIKFHAPTSRTESPNWWRRLGNPHILQQRQAWRPKEFLWHFGGAHVFQIIVCMGEAIIPWNWILVHVSFIMVTIARLLYFPVCAGNTGGHCSHPFVAYPCIFCGFRWRKLPL